MYCLKVSFYGKSLNFYAHKIEEENILSRKNKKDTENVKLNKNGKVEI